MTRTITTLAIVVLLTAATNSSAATFTWDNANTTGNWTTGSNWVGASAPPNDDTANVVIDGEGSTNVVVTLDGINHDIDTIDISLGDTLVASGANQVLRLQDAATSGVFNNAGTMRADGVTFFLRGNLSTANTNSGIIEAINGGTFRFDSGDDSYTLDNTGGTIRAINGTIALRNKNIVVTGGALSLDATSTLNGPDVQVRYTFDDTTTTNAGTIDWVQEVTAGTREKFLAFGGAGTFSNTGTIDLIQRSDVAGVNRIHDVRIEDTTAFTNQVSGIVNITTENAGAITGGNQRARFNIDSTAAAGFSNLGTINITHETDADPLYVAELVSGGSIANAGTINVDGSSASIELGANDFTQTAGRLHFDNDGSITAGNVNIQGGELAGTGTINGDVDLDGTLDMEIDALIPTNDLLTINGNLTLDAGTSVLNLDLINGDPSGGGVLVNYTGTLTGSFSSIIGLPEGFSIDLGTLSNSQITLLAPVPEPSTLGHLALGLMFCFRRARTRRN